ncbi:unnamed protein product, partial [Symbiodinium sp. KB8]
MVTIEGQSNKRESEFFALQPPTILKSAIKNDGLEIVEGILRNYQTLSQAMAAGRSDDDRSADALAAAYRRVPRKQFWSAMHVLRVCPMVDNIIVDQTQLSCLVLWCGLLDDLEVDEDRKSVVRSCSKIAIDVSKKRMKAVIEGMKKLTQSSYADCKAACEGLGVKCEMPDVKEAAALNAWHLERLAGSLNDMTVSGLPRLQRRDAGDTSYRTMKPSERPPTLGEVLNPIQMFMQLLNVDATLFDDYETGEEFYQSVMDGLHEDADKLIRSFNSVGPFKFVDNVVTGARLHKVPTSDTMSEFYSIIRSRPYTPVDCKRSFNKVRKVMAQPAELTEEGHRACERSRGAHIATRVLAYLKEHNRLPRVHTAGSSKFLRRMFSNRTVDVNLLHPESASLEEWRKPVTDKACSLKFSDILALFDRDTVGVDWKTPHYRRLLLELFHHGKPAVRDTVRDYLLGRLPVDNLHMLYNEKERNYRTYKAREYAMFTITPRDVMGVTERAIREDLIRDMPAVTLGREYHKLTVDLMDFLRQPSAAKSLSRASRQKRHGFIMQLLEAEREMLMSMGEGEREAWIDNNCRSSFLSSGRMPEGTGQTRWTVHGQADITADCWDDLEENSELIGTGDDMLIRVETFDSPRMVPAETLKGEYAKEFVSKLRHARDKEVNGAALRQKTMNRLKTAILVSVVPHNNKILSTKAAYCHVHTISVGMRELFVDSVTNEKRDGKHLRLIGTGSSMTWRHVVEMMLTRPASLSGMPIIGLSGHTVRRFIQRACSMTEKLYRHLSKACNNAKSSEQLDLEVELNNIREGSPEHIYHLCDDRMLLSTTPCFQLPQMFAESYIVKTRGDVGSAFYKYDLIAAKERWDLKAAVALGEGGGSAFKSVLRSSTCKFGHYVSIMDRTSFIDGKMNVWSPPSLDDTSHKKVPMLPESVMGPSDLSDSDTVQHQDDESELVAKTFNATVNSMTIMTS